jgi:hypothetical protein
MERLRVGYRLPCFVSGLFRYLEGGRWAPGHGVSSGVPLGGAIPQRCADESDRLASPFGVAGSTWPPMSHKNAAISWAIASPVALPPRRAPRSLTAGSGRRVGAECYRDRADPGRTTCRARRLITPRRQEGQAADRLRPVRRRRYAPSISRCSTVDPRPENARHPIWSFLACVSHEDLIQEGHEWAPCSATTRDSEKAQVRSTKGNDFLRCPRKMA